MFVFSVLRISSVIPRDGNEAGRQLCDDVRIPDHDVRPSHDMLTALLKKVSNIGELLDKQSGCIGGRALLLDGHLDLERLVESDTDERTRKQIGELINPITQQMHHARITRVELDSVRQIRKFRVFFHSKKVMQMSIELEIGDDVNVPLTSVCDDPPYFILGETAFRIQ